MEYRNETNQSGVDEEITFAKSSVNLRELMLAGENRRKSICLSQEIYAWREKPAKKHKPCSEILCLQGKIGEKAVAFQERLLPVRKRQEKSSTERVENTVCKEKTRKKQYIPDGKYCPQGKCKKKAVGPIGKATA